MREKLGNLIDLFNDSSFKQFAPLFFEKDINETDVHKATKISRTIIHKIRKKFDIYFEPSRNVGNTSGKQYQLKIELLSDYFTQLVKLNENEAKLLLKIISDPSIKFTLIRDNYDTDALIGKTILTILLIRVMGGDDSWTDRAPLSYVINIIFREFMRGKFWDVLLKDKKLSDEKRKLYYKDEKMDFTKLVEDSKESNDYESAIRKYGKQFGDEQQIFYGLIKKIYGSQIPITTYPSTWYGILQFSLIPVLKYSHMLDEKEFDEWLDRELQNSNEREKSQKQKSKKNKKSRSSIK